MRFYHFIRVYTCGKLRPPLGGGSHEVTGGVPGAVPGDRGVP